MPTRTAPRSTPRRSRTLAVLLAAGAALLAVVLALGDGSDTDAEPGGAALRSAGAGAGSEAAPGPEARGAGPMALGAADAPVVMVMYSEFQCPFCGTFARDTEPELVERFVDEGTLRIEWRDLPYLGPESLTAAAAGRAAAEQGAFWELADRLYAEQAPPNSGRLTVEHLVGVAGELGFDVERFRSDMEDQALLDAVKADVNEAVGLGVTGTPAFFVNGEVIIGAQPTEVFVDAIERAAAAG